MKAIEATAERPIGKRQIIVEGNNIYVRRSKQLVEMRPLAVLARMLNAVPDRPVRRIGNQILVGGRVLCQPRAIEDATDIRRKLDQAGDEGIIPRA